MNDIIEETQEVNANDESNSPIIMMDEHDNNDIQQRIIDVSFIIR